MAGFLGYSINKIVKDPNDPDSTWFKRNYLLSASAVAIFTAFVSLKIIYVMNAGELDLGLGLVSIGIVTFIGTTLSSSIFEEHRHKHEENNHPLINVIVGQGIMRRSLAASLVITYIVLIGLSFGAGTLNDSINGEETPKEETKDPPSSTTGNTSSENTSEGNVNTNVSVNLENIGQFLKENKQIDEITLKKTDPVSKEMQEIILTKEPETLVEHFTIVISVVIGFYFGANAISSIIKSRNTTPTAKDILKTMFIKGEIQEAAYKVKLDLIKD